MKKNNHQDMVKQLCKSGSDIVEQLTPNSAHLLHMAVGIAGEAGELLEAVMFCDSISEVNLKNITEELGDSEFYIEGFRQEMGFKREDTLQVKSIDYSGYGESLIDAQLDCARFSMIASKLLDEVKKMAIYVKPINANACMVDLKYIEIQLENIRQHFGILHNESIEHNINKLYSGKNARYGKGKFSNKQANMRTDKNIKNVKVIPAKPIGDSNETSK